MASSWDKFKVAMREYGPDLGVFVVGASVVVLSYMAFNNRRKICTVFSERCSVGRREAARWAEDLLLS